MRTSHFSVVPFFVVGALAACGGSTSGSSSGASGSAVGTVGGSTLSVASVVGVVGGSSESGSCQETVDGGNQVCPSSFSREVAVLLTNRSDATCGAIQSDVASNTSFTYANFDDLEVAVDVANGDVVAGTYSIVPSGSSSIRGAYASFTTTTATCATGSGFVATSGTVTLTQVNSTSVAGTYNVTFGSKGAFSGSFDVPICSFDAGIMTAPPKQVCRP